MTQRFTTITRSALSLALVAGLGVTACKKPDAEKSVTADTAKIAEAATVYGYAMVMNYAVMYESNIDTKSPQYRGPINQINSTARVYTPADTAIVTPNSDTPYSMLQLDLRAEPIVICVPAIPKERYYSVQFVDMTAFNYGYIGSRATGNDAGCYMVAGPNWQGETPKGIKAVYRNDTQFGLTVFRTQLFNAADIENVRKIQAGYSARPLSAFLGTTPPPAAPPVDWPAIDKQSAKTDAFKYINFLMQFMPAQPDDVATRAEIAKIGVVPGKAFDATTLTQAQKTALADGMKAGNESVMARARSLGSKQNGWLIAKIENTRAATKGDWLQRAAVAQAGIYANDYQEALYPFTREDSTGAMLDGSKASYTITFPGNAMPPVNAFWSVTMYDGKTQLLINNPINRYLINTPMLPAMKKNPDGGLTIYVSKDSPGKDKESNWLPAPDGEIYMAMRLYWPKLAELDAWKPPAVEKTQ